MNSILTFRYVNFGNKIRNFPINSVLSVTKNISNGQKKSEKLQELNNEIGIKSKNWNEIHNMKMTKMTDYGDGKYSG